MAAGGTEMTVAALLSRLRRARRKAMKRVNVGLDVFMPNGNRAVRIIQGWK